VGKPQDLHGLTDVLENPAYATSVGLLLWGMRQAPSGEQEAPRVALRLPGEWWPRIRDWLRAFIPG
jgi:cell division protein FtsA